MDESKVLNLMTAGDKRAVMKFADANMNLSKAARLAYLSRRAVWYRLNKVRNNTGFDPYDFHDLAFLVQAIESERRRYDEQQ